MMPIPPRGLAAAGASSLVAAIFLFAPPAQAAARATITQLSTWSTGYEGKVTITNDGPGQLNGWTVAFNLPSGTSISSSWDSVRTVSAQRFSFANAGWNGVVPVGGTASFGFIASGVGLPSSCTI